MTATSSVARRAVRGGAITVTGQIIRIALQVVGLIILSRLLDPEAFGIVAIAQVIITSGEVLRDLGLTPAAIQADTLSHQQHSNLFWLNLSFAIVLTVCGLATAPILDDIFQKPQLVAVAAALTPLFLLNAAQSPFQIDLIRSSRFGPLVCTEVAAQALGLIVCSGAAVAGWSHWALVTQALTIGILSLLMKAAVSGWRPSRPARRAGTRPLVTYGLHLSAAQLLNLASNNADTVALAYTSTTANVGLYNRGYQLLSAPMQQLLAPLSNVAVPLLAQTRHDEKTFRNYLRRAQSAVALPMVWLFATSAALAEPIVDSVLGSSWERTSDVFEVLALGGVFQQLSFVSFWAFLSLGLTKELVKYNIVTKLATIVAIAIGTQWGLIGVAWAVSASLAASWIINLVWLARTAALPVVEFLIPGLRIISLAGIASSLCRYFYENADDLAAPVRLLCAVVVSVTVYLALTLIVAPTRRDLGAILQRLRRHPSS